MTVDEVRRLLARQFKDGTAGGWAKSNGISAAYVSDVLRGYREPGEKILIALGLECIKDYRKLK